MMFISKEAMEKIGAKFVIDRIQTQTPYGNKAKKEMKPYEIGQEEDLRQHLNIIEEVTRLIGNHRYTFVEIRNQFKKLKDLSGSFERIQSGEALSVPELFEIKSLTIGIREIAGAMEGLVWDVPASLKVERLNEVEALLDPESQGINTFYLYDAYSEELSSVRKAIKKLDDELKFIGKEKRLRVEDKLGIRVRPNGEVTVSKENKEMIHALEACEDLSYSAETYMNITYRIREDERVDAIQAQKEQLIQEEDAENYRVREMLSESLKDHVDALIRNTGAIGQFDLIIAKCYFGIGFNCIKPTILDTSSNRIFHLNIEKGRHPAVEERLKREEKAYKPVSIQVNEGVTCITGANMGGKTVTLKMIGNLVWLAQMGLFVPAESMSLSLRNFIFVSIGDEQDVDLGLSTFGGEIVKVSKAVELSSHQGLILIDELARGTNPKEGYAISKALINQLKTRSSITLITTHFDGLADADDVMHLQVCGLQNVDFSKLKNEIDDPEVGMDILHDLMDYRLKVIHNPQEVPKDAVRIAHLMGLDQDILEDARSILNEFNREESL